jgi:hypothetical protein
MHREVFKYGKPTFRRRENTNRNGDEKMTDDIDYENERYEYIGIANVRFDAQGVTPVMVYKDHEEKCIRLRQARFGTPTLAWVPHYDEEENANLWLQINEHKQQQRKSIFSLSRYKGAGKRRPSKSASRFATRAGRPMGLPEIKPRSPSERSTKKVSIAEVSAMIAKEMGDIFGGDE